MKKFSKLSFVFVSNNNWVKLTITPWSDHGHEGLPALFFPPGILISGAETEGKRRVLASPAEAEAEIQF